MARVQHSVADDLPWRSPRQVCSNSAYVVVLHSRPDLGPVSEVELAWRMEGGKAATDRRQPVAFRASFAYASTPSVDGACAGRRREPMPWAMDRARPAITIRVPATRSAAAVCRARGISGEHLLRRTEIGRGGQADCHVAPGAVGCRFLSGVVTGQASCRVCLATQGSESGLTLVGERGADARIQ